MVKGPLPLPYPENFIERANFQRMSSTNAFCFTMSLREGLLLSRRGNPPEGYLVKIGNECGSCAL